MAQIHSPVATPQAQPITVILHGNLARFGPKITLYANDAVQALSGLAGQITGFAESLRQGRYRLIVGNLDSGRPLTGAELTRPFDCQKLHLIPVVGGAGRGRGKALLGLTLLGLSFIPGSNAAVGGAFGSVGQSIAGASGQAAFQQFGSQLLGQAGGLFLLAGVAEILSPQAASPAGILPSSAIATPETTGQGAAIPLAYGNARITAPLVISSGLDIETH